MKRSWIALALVGAGLAGCQDSPPAEARTFEYAVGTLDCHPTGLGGAVPKGRFELHESPTAPETRINLSERPTT